MKDMKSSSSRTDLTFKYNMSQSRHGWFRLTPAYSVRLVQEILKDTDRSIKVFDPFSGTATTTLAATLLGFRACSCDINPFLIWLGNVKLAVYSPTILHSVKKIAEKIEYEKCSLTPVAPPPISSIERWWDNHNLLYLCQIKAGIEKFTKQDTHERNLLLIAFCRTIIEISNASYGHQSVSFKKKKHTVSTQPFWDSMESDHSFLYNVEYITETAQENPQIQGYVVHDDARSFRSTYDRYDRIITSPPYPNRMSYIRELRPYMYWLGYLQKTCDSGLLDWETIGGTWGTATSRLKDWKPQHTRFLTKTLKLSLDQIADVEHQSGMLLSNYVFRYFADMWQHLHSIRQLITPTAELHYVIGNSKFYDVMVHTEQIYAEMLDMLGYRNIEIKPIRKRSSKKELFEFDVVAHV